MNKMLLILALGICFVSSAIHAEQQLGELELVAAVIRGDGTILPVPKNDFYIFNTKDHLDQLARLNGAGPRPDLDDYCKALEGSSACIPNFDALHKAEEEWNAKAYKGRDEYEKKIGYKRYDVKTNLKGELKVKLPIGTWYVLGDYSLGDSTIYWQYVPVTITTEGAYLELSNDNGLVF